MKNKITISLISHTNIGKTSLARTLLREDIGHVDDSPHTTLECQEQELVRAGQEQLLLWDTPGFGGVNAFNIAKRIKEAGSAKGWLMHQVVDRISDRSLYSSVEAAKNIRLKSDVVVYLVDNRLSPAETGYLEGELTLLDALGKPVIIALNHLRIDGTEFGRNLEQWRQVVIEHEIVKGLCSIDAFSRAWFQELDLLQRVRSVLPADDQELMFRLIEAYLQRQTKIDKSCFEEIAKVVDFASKQRVEESKLEAHEVFRRLYLPLDGRFRESVAKMVELYSLDMAKSPQLEADISQLSGQFQKKIPERATGLVAGAVTGAGGGLAADLMAGGLSFGGGALLGFIVGGITGLAAAKGINALIKNDGVGRWRKKYLVKLLKQSLLFYLLISHHGRGKGILDLKSDTKTWQVAVDEVVDGNNDQLMTLLPGDFSAAELLPVVVDLNSKVIKKLYPA